MTRLRLYFGHPINTYGSDLERRLIDEITAVWPGAQLVNPGEAEHIAVCARMAAAGEQPMRYFLNEVVPSCQLGVFLPFRDGRFGAGVHAEAECLTSLGRPVWAIAPDGTFRRLYPAQEQPLTVEETRSRIRDAVGKPIPY